MFSLDFLSAVSLTGPDAGTYAQSQFTAAIDTLPGDRWSPLAWCDPKGHTIAFMLARPGDERIDLVLPAAQAEAVADGLRRFTIGRKVEISAPGSVAGTFTPGEGGAPLGEDPARALEAHCRAPADPDASHRWQGHDIKLGLPWLAAASSARHLPQWLGIEALGGLSYDKGCYPGQEVIARLHYRGSVKYRLAGLLLDGPADIEAHAALVDGIGAAVGRWLWGRREPDRTPGLAVLSVSIEDGESLQIASADGPVRAQVTPHDTLC